MPSIKWKYSQSEGRFWHVLYKQQIVSEQHCQPHLAVHRPAGGLSLWLYFVHICIFDKAREQLEKRCRFPTSELSGIILLYRVCVCVRASRLEDGSQYLFAASSRELQLLWVKKLQNCSKSVSSDSDDSGWEHAHISTSYCVCFISPSLYFLNSSTAS